MNKYLSFIFASVLTLTGVQLSKASNPSDSLAIVSAKWERTSSLQGIHPQPDQWQSGRLSSLYCYAGLADHH